MSDDYKLQASVKFGPGQIGMINLRADTPEEMRGHAAAVVGLVGDLAVMTEALNTEFAAVSAVASAFPGTTVIQQQQAPQAPANQGNGNVCPHGQMMWRESPDGGQSWKGYFCSLPKGDPAKCKPRYVR